MEDLNKLLEEYNQKNMQKELDRPFTYIENLPSKNIRSKMTVAFNYWMNIPLEKLNEIGEIMQMLHNASLMIDDIEDNSSLRRSHPVAHSIYGIANTLNTANYFMFLTLERCQQLGHPDAVNVYTECVLELHRGQGMEIYWRESNICPSESEYQLMTIRKTGGLFMLGIGLMQLFSENKKNFRKLTAILGLYFQIRDDYINLTNEEYSATKSFCEDLTEGKFSFPILHAVNNKKNDREILDILKQRTDNIELKKYCVQLLDEAGSFQYTRNILKKLYEEARAEIKNLGTNEYMDKLLHELSKY